MPDNPDHPVLRVRMDPLVTWDRLDCLVQVALLELQEVQELPDHRDHLVLKDHRAMPDRVVLWVDQGVKDQLETPDPKVLMER